MSVWLPRQPAMLSCMRHQTMEAGAWCPGSDYAHGVHVLGQALGKQLAIVSPQLLLPSTGHPMW